MISQGALNFVRDPMAPAKILWPDVHFYDRQIEIIQSVEDNVETVVVAANMLGKDFVAAYVVVSLFLRGGDSVRIVTTSVKDDHLRVLWGEIDRYIKTAKYPLLAGQGGPLIYNHREIWKVENGQKNGYSYVKGMVSETGEGLSGHHAKKTLFVGDESSGIRDSAYQASLGWAERRLLFGNAFPSNGFFRKACRDGNLELKAA